MVRLKARPVRRALQEQIRAQPTISFHDVVVDAATRKQEDADATMKVTKIYDPLHMKEESLAPSLLSAIHTALGELALNVASLKQELSSLKRDSASSPKAENPLLRDTNEDRKHWW